MKKNPALSVDVLKVGHHGSKSSTTEEFLEQVITANGPLYL